MNPNNSIEVRNVNKYFKIYGDKGHMLRERLVHFKRNQYEKKTVLNDISFDVKKGEALGLIGKNGCGKSTTLKMLTKILKPNSGTIISAGRIYSLIELGAGFHPDMTGRENVYINASIYGIKAKEVDQKIDDIIAFAELEDFIDNPVRTYSSGMYMRLAFSVAISVDADILLVDEILAVGDSAFQKKCFDKLYELKKNGMTIVLVSHSLDQVKSFCDRVIWIEKGDIKMQGKASEVCELYLKEIMQKGSRPDGADIVEESGGFGWLSTFADDRSKRDCGNETYFTKIRMMNASGQECNEYHYNDKLIIEMEYESKQFDVPLNVVLYFYRDDRTMVNAIISKELTKQETILSEKGIVRYCVDRLNLLQGEYCIDFRIQDANQISYDYLERMVNFRVVGEKGHYESGIAAIEHYWEME